MTKKVILTFPAEATERPLTYDIIRIYDIKVNILKAEVQSGETGFLLMEMDADASKIEQAIAFLNENGVTVSSVASKVSYDDARCISCGNCASACFSRALTIEAPAWKLRFNPEKCIACALCLKTCPLNLFKIEFSEI